MSGGVFVMEQLGAVIDPAQLLQAMLDVARDVVSEVQKAKVDREQIAAWEHVQTDKILAQREILLKALELTFDERRENFRRMFDGLDQAMAVGDSAQAASFLESITDLAKTSPFKELANVQIIVSELKRPGQVWDV